MSHSFDPVFSDWYTKKCIGNGTDGRVYTIEKKTADGKIRRSVLKTIRVSPNRNENKNYNSITDSFSRWKMEDVDKAIDDITSNIETIKGVDGGKHFVRYLDWEVRNTSDNKGKIILIRLEEMRSLTNLLDNFAFTLEETTKLGISICKSLCRCRDFGYIYPNLKPENILFNRKGLCKLGDFGSFSCLEPAKSSVAFKRTEYYMAPEFIKTGKINGTCDTYSLGLVLYMLLNRGRLPFTEMWPQEVTINGLNRSKENRMSGLPLPRPATADDALYRIISKACAFRVEDRYLSPKQMLSDLTSALNNEPIEETQFDEIYSSDFNIKSEKTVNNEPYKDVNVTDEKRAVYDQYKSAKDPLRPAVKLHEEIAIPNIYPSDYGTDNKKRQRKRPVSCTPIQVGKPKKKDNGNIKTILAMITAIAAVLVLLIVSLTLRASACDVLTDDLLLQELFITVTEVILNGC